MIEYHTVLTCPHCGHRSRQSMPDLQTLTRWNCNNCHTDIQPRPGECCVFCSFGSVPCPDAQRAWEQGQSGNCCSGE
ncbi:MAG TPA: hypothetical protein ENK41_01820 [Rhodobacteraceae bacterium]|nr:hypothetical protein [Paracoccaceae bacterium]